MYVNANDIPSCPSVKKKAVQGWGVKYINKQPYHESFHKKMHHCKPSQQHFFHHEFEQHELVQGKRWPKEQDQNPQISENTS